MSDTATSAVLPGVPHAVLREIDVAHRCMRDAFRHCDSTGYAAFLSPDFTWHDSDGQAHSAEAITRDVQRQFARLVDFDTQFERAESTLDGLCVTETGRQVAQIALRVFLVFAVRWDVERTGSYTWKRGPEGWRLQGVRLRSEQTRFGGVRFAGLP